MFQPEADKAASLDKLPPMADEEASHAKIMPLAKKLMKMNEATFPTISLLDNKKESCIQPALTPDGKSSAPQKMPL